MNCSTCAFFKGFGRNEGRCQRFPPVLLRDATDNEAPEWRQPWIDDATIGVCGEWKARV